MHLGRKATNVAPSARFARRASMAIDALWILAVGAHSTRRQAGDVTQRIQLAGRGLQLVRMGAVEPIRTIVAQIVHVAHLERLDALDVEAVVFNLWVDALPDPVARDCPGRCVAAYELRGLGSAG